MMERGEPATKRARAPSVVPLRLDRFIPQRDVRRLIWRHLKWADREVVRCAHNSAYRPPSANELAVECCASGHLALLQCVHRDYVKEGVTGKWFRNAACGGHVDVLAWLLDSVVEKIRGRYRKAAFEGMATGGHVRVFEFLQQRRIHFLRDYVDLCILAAQHGHLSMLMLLWTQTHPTTHSSNAKLCLQEAARNGHVHVMEWLEKYVRVLDSILYVRAAANKHMHVLQWLSARGVECRSRDIFVDDEDMARWAYLVGILKVTDTDVWNLSASLGVLKFSAEELGVAIDWQVASRNFQDENTEDCDLVRYFVSKQHSLLNDGELLCWAAEMGFLDTVHLLHEMGAPLEADACVCAAHGGQLETLQWLRAQGCPWNDDVITSACENAYIAVAEWALSNGCPFNANQAMENTDDPATKAWLATRPLM